jgi:hypothetical protein
MEKRQYVDVGLSLSESELKIGISKGYRPLNPIPTPQAEILQK